MKLIKQYLGIATEFLFDVIAECNLIPEKDKDKLDVSPFGAWRKKQFEYRKAYCAYWQT